MDEREANLPKWAQQVIQELRKSIKHLAEGPAREIAKLTRENVLYQRRFEAMTELLECAARGDHKTAQEIVSIIQAYSLELVKDEDA